MKKDTKKISREYIIEKPGYLAAKIVYNNLYDNNFDLFFIGNMMGNTLYTVQLNNNERAIVSFTSNPLLESYVNRGVVKKTLNERFGNSIVSVKMNICTLDAILSAYDYDDENTVKTLIINPNTKDYFIPIRVDIFSSMIIDSGYFNEEDVEFEVDERDVQKMEYDKEEKKFFFLNELN